MTDDGHRYERKFVLEDVRREDVEALIRIHPAHFFRSHATRRVNSMYADTAGLRSRAENLAGVAARTKVRVRWYGALWGDVDRPLVEIKLKRGLVGSKVRFDAKPFVMREDALPADLAAALAPDGIAPVAAAALLGRSPVLVTSYERSYFTSWDGRFRLTLDADLLYLRARGPGRGTVRSRADARLVVMELKYAPDAEADASRVAGFLPVRPGRSSKYVRGIELLYPAG